MKHAIIYPAILMLATALSLNACDDNSSSGGGGTILSAGDTETCTAGNTTFTMAYVPGGITFPTETDDSGSATVDSAYWIGTTEVTYSLWYAVRAWAVNNGYHFANTGCEGNDGTPGAVPTSADEEPVTMINWRDAMVWCNAFTEWSNENNGTGYDCVYASDPGYATAVRDSRDGAYGSSNNETAGSFDNPYVNIDARGFRLPDSDEWELAARWREDDTNAVAGYSDPFFTRGDSASGAAADYNDADATVSVAWYSESSTHAVMGKTASALGLYDMSGNVWELCFTELGPARTGRGGSWDDDTNTLQIGSYNDFSPYYERDDIGFRFARTE